MNQRELGWRDGLPLFEAGGEQPIPDLAVFVVKDDDFGGEAVLRRVLGGAGLAFGSDRSAGAGSVTA
jgi:hypothetical protein